MSNLDELTPCARCGRLTPQDELVSVKTLSASRIDPPEYEDLCRLCADPDPVGYWMREIYLPQLAAIAAEVGER